MSARKPSAKTQQLKAKRAELKDLDPKSRAAQKVKGGPNGPPWARKKERPS